MAQPAECRHHLVGDGQDFILPADLLGALVIARRRDNYAPRAHDGLGNKASNIFRTDAFDGGLHVLNQVIAEFRDVHVVGTPIGIG